MKVPWRGMLQDIRVRGLGLDRRKYDNFQLITMVLWEEGGTTDKDGAPMDNGIYCKYPFNCSC